ncbi:uncharacterized protein B0H18DRAFT_1114616 [Fomitopsis serialis]|uniref:uncharacterized protein n=1 Tax=Fomitopsis serialis TaxID=139415 RepID=UPI00200825D0|nr:uncharacterized protein B0H18DRAFT_1114616 [Neoantrodia serialis]KAH9934758.1 hypothetical protein B0H18DRAFT_1114616 [Neoantrodia serialis]
MPGTNNVLIPHFSHATFRRKKKRCDAKRPYCTTCEVAGKQQECLYEENVQHHLTEALIARTLELENRLAVYEGQSQTSSPEQSGRTSQADDPSSLSVLPSSPLPLALDGSSTLDITFPGAISNLGASYTPDLIEQFMSSEGSTPSSTASSSRSTLISSQDLTDYRATFLAHHCQLGISLTEQRLQAIMNGDMSGTYIHPVLVHVAQVIGCRFWQVQRRIVINSSVETTLLQHVEQAMSDTPAPVTRLQVHCILAIYFLLKRQMRERREQLMKAAQVTLHNNIRFDTHTAEAFASLENTIDEAHEQICALSQFMYLDKAAAIVLNDPSLLTSDYDQQLNMLPYMFPIMTKSNLVVIRARSIALLQESHRLAVRWTEIMMNMGAFDPQATLNDQTKWYDDYWELMENVLEHISTLTVSTLKSSFGGQRELALALKMCTIVSLTAAAELHRLLAGHHPDSRTKCLNTALEIISITKELRDDDYHFLDPILGTCWSMIAALLDQQRPYVEEQSQLKASYDIILSSANKLGLALPYMEHSLVTIKNVAPSDNEGRSQSF